MGAYTTPPCGLVIVLVQLTFISLPNDKSVVDTAVLQTTQTAILEPSSDPS